MHQTKSNKLVPAKIFRGQVICCDRACAAKIPIERQREIFSAYYQACNWTTKTLYIRANVDKVKNIRTNSLNPIINLRNQQYIYKYSFLNEAGIRTEVCKKFFLKCIQVSQNRVYRAIVSVNTNPSAEERRGSGPSPNKSKTVDVENLKHFINKFPRYKSHYGRSSSDKDYLSPYLNIRRMYREYKILCEFEGKQALSEHIFREVFNKQFNLSFKRPNIDTCKVCDMLNLKLSDQNISFDEHQIQTKYKNDHDEDVTRTKMEFLYDIEKGKQSHGKLQCLTFDLQKTLETPSLSVNEAYYMRKLWTYNLCIYDEVIQKGFMYIWSEDQASRGAEEIASCLKYHIQNNIPDEAKQITLYSDSCVGQNKNIKVVLMLKKILAENQHLDEIMQKFFVSGHSYNSCDRCFGLIEKQKRITSQIFTVEHWIQLISQAKKTEPLFYVQKMESSMFFSTKNLQKLIVNRKKNTEGAKINWHKIRLIQLKKEDLFSLYIKQQNGVDKEKIDIGKKTVTVEQFIGTDLTRLNEGYHLISVNKYNDLQRLLKYIPISYHDFYRKLKIDDNNIDVDYNLASESESDDEDID